MVSVEGVSGFDVGMVTLTGEAGKAAVEGKGVDENNPDIKKLLRKATDRDLDLLATE